LLDIIHLAEIYSTALLIPQITCSLYVLLSSSGQLLLLVPDAVSGNLIVPEEHNYTVQYSSVYFILHIPANIWLFWSLTRGAKGIFAAFYINILIEVNSCYVHESCYGLATDCSILVGCLRHQFSWGFPGVRMVDCCCCCWIPCIYLN